MRVLDYIIASSFLHLTVMLALICAAPEVNTISQSGPIEVKIIQKSKNTAIVVSPPKSLIPGRDGLNTKKEEKSDVLNSGGEKEVPEVDLETYADYVKAKVDPIWIHNISKVLNKVPPNITTEVLVAVAQSGKILSTKILKSSGNSLYDKTVLETLEMASSLPKPPEIVIKDGIIWTFEI